MRRLLPLLLLFTYSLFLIPSPALAGDYQQCETGSTCTIGEFLYGDDYTPLTGQSCTLTAKYPDGTAFLSSQALTGRSDGWYSYDATLGTTEGLYSATICCTPSSGLMCLDKSFEVKAPSTSPPTPEDIWGYSDRTLTSYGTLVNDIWNASTRSLTTFGSLISDVWGHSTRTMTSFGTLVADILGTTPSSSSGTSAGSSPATLTSIVAEQNVQRELLEKLVNEPVISLSLDEGVSIPDLETKLEESKKQASALYDLVSSSKSRLMALDAKWDRMSETAIEGEITAISSLFQNIPSLAYLSKAWETTPLTSLNTGASELKTHLASVLSVSTLTKSKVAPASLTSSLKTLSNLESVLGDATSLSSDPTLYGYLAKVEERNSTLLSENQKIAALLEDLNGQGVQRVERQVTSLKSRLLTLNEYPGGESLATPAKLAPDPKLNLKNILFSLQGLIGLNRMQLAMHTGDPLRSLWLEEGSIIFRAVITNPSGIISQSVPLKFYLPREVKTQDIITLDPSLETTYDAKEEALYAHGKYELKPKETKIVFVEIEDIWSLSDSELQTLRTQAANLLRPLEKTAYYSQGTTLKSDIDVTLDKVALSTGKAITPENKIRTYREAKLELAKVNSSMNRLQDLVAQSSGTGSVFGFVGGVQTVAVWGMILVIVAGFVFLSLYFKKLQPSTPLLSTINDLQPTISPPSWQLPAIIVVVVILTAASTIAFTRLTKQGDTPPIINQITSSPSPSPSPSVMPVRNDIIIKSPKDVLGVVTPEYSLVVPPDSSVNVRNKPSSDADIIMAVGVTRDVIVFKESGDWRQIGFSEADLTKGYWVHSKFIEEK